MIQLPVISLPITEKKVKWLKQLLTTGDYELIPEKQGVRPFVNAKVPDTIKLKLLKASKERGISQKRIIVSALKEYLK